uniref:DNA oxidative demethylase ALKBH2 n=1 Tax=Strigamia maritima TaxID=126957 RepID=T1J0X2_STRMM
MGSLARVKVYGQWFPIPRKQVAYSNNKNLTYTFSGNKIPVRPWTPLIEALRDIIYESGGPKFNFPLVNRYADGRDKIGAHRDDEPDLDKTSPIASLSFGATRKFKLSPVNKQFLVKPFSIDLAHGSLLIMHPPTNKHWKHEIPAQASMTTPRINITFRTMKLK